MKRDYLEEIKKFTERRVHPDEILSLNLAKNENRKIICLKCDKTFCRHF